MPPSKQTKEHVRVWFQRNGRLELTRPSPFHVEFKFNEWKGMERKSVVESYNLKCHRHWKPPLPRLGTLTKCDNWHLEGGWSEMQWSLQHQLCLFCAKVHIEMWKHLWYFFGSCPDVLDGVIGGGSQLPNGSLKLATTRMSSGGWVGVWLWSWRCLFGSIIKVHVIIVQLTHRQ